jgi:hypothetical protein
MSADVRFVVNSGPMTGCLSPAPAIAMKIGRITASLPRGRCSAAFIMNIVGCRIRQAQAPIYPLGETSAFHLVR